MIMMMMIKELLIYNKRPFCLRVGRRVTIIHRSKECCITNLTAKLHILMSQGRVMGGFLGGSFHNALS
jgi:hypothetical protein